MVRWNSGSNRAIVEKHSKARSFDFSLLSTFRRLLKDEDGARGKGSRKGAQRRAALELCRRSGAPGAA